MATLSGRPNTGLPTPASQFIGRRRELTQVKRLLGRSRLVTLVGAAGSGKTRLALEAARGVSDAPHRKPLVWVELAPLSDESAVPNSFAAACGLHGMRSPLAADLLLDHLNDFNGLIVVDNCEHLVGACAQLVDRLLRACPRLSILATSREQLRVDGETVWPVPTLSASEAVQLFVARARQVVPEFDLSESNGEHVGSICRRLDGLPLAVELAAARVSVLDPRSIDEQLNDRFRLLTGGLRTAPPRHRTLRAAIDWSYDLLTDGERALFIRTAVFAGGFDLDAAIAVGTGGSVDTREVLDLLGSLIDKSLIVSVQDPPKRRRYRLLESLRAYGRERLTENGELDVRMRLHARHFAGPATGGPDAPYSHGRFQRVPPEEVDNFREALAWSRRRDPNLHLNLACAFGWFCNHSGDTSEGRSWLEPAIQRSDDIALLARAHTVLSALAWRQGDGAAAERYAVRAVELSRGLDDSPWLARALGNLAFMHIGALQLNEAEVALREEFSIVEALADRRLRAESLYHAGLLEAHRGQLAAAQDHLAESVALHEALGLEDDNAPVNSVFGWVLVRLGDTARARGAIAVALRTRLRLNAVSDAAGSLDAAAEVAFLEGAAERAMRLKGAADLIYERGHARPTSLAAASRSRWVTQAERSLGDAARAAWSEGHQWKLEDAAIYALAPATEPPRRRAGRDAEVALTARELQIAELVATGVTNDDVARGLGLSTRTVDAHLDHIRTKLGVRSRVEIANWIASAAPASPLP
jgi:predicted ATPase/DNA-binding CsgD family transcriptional regulator